MAGIKIVDLPALGRDLISTDLLEVSLNGSGSRKITGQEIMNASKLAVGSTPIVSGTVGRLLFQNTGDVLGQSANLFWDNTNGRLGIGISSPSTTFAIGSGGINRVNLGIQAFEMYTPSSVRTVFLGYSSTSGQLIISSGGSNDVNFLGGGFKSISTGNFAIGSTTDAGFKLDVNGTARVQGNVEIGGASATTVSSTYNSTTRNQNRYTNNSSFEFHEGVNERMRIAAGGNVGIGTSTFVGSIKLAVNGQIGGPTFSSTYLDLTGGTPELRGNSGIGFYGSAGNHIFYGSSSAERMRIIGSTGHVSIGTTNSFDRLQNNGGMCFGAFNNATINYGMGEGNHTYLQFATNGVNVMRISPIQNVLIGTATDAGFKLDVNGTARVNSMFHVTNSSFTGSLRIESFANAQQRILGGPSESIAFGQAGNTIHLNTAEAYVSNSLLGPKFWIQANGSTLIGAQSTAAASALFELRTTTQGFLPPRMTNAQRAAIASPAVGLIVYCTDSTEGLYVYKSTGWTFMV